LAVRRIPWYKQWQIYVAGREPLSDVVRPAGCRLRIPPELARSPLHRPRHSRPYLSPLLRMSTTETQLRSSSVLLQLRKHPTHAQHHPCHRLPTSCNRRHRHRRLSSILSLIRTTKVSRASAAVGLTVVVRVSMRRSPWLHNHRPVKEIIWSAHLAGKEDTLVLVPMAVLVARLLATRPPPVPLPFLPGQPVVVTILTKAQGKDSTALPRPTAWVSPSILMEMLLWTRWQMCIVNSNRPKQGKPRRHRHRKHYRLHQCNTNNPQPSSNNCKHLVVVWPYGLHNVRQESPIHMCRLLLGRLSPRLSRHNSTSSHQQRHSRVRTTRLRMCNLHTHMQTRHHRRSTMPRS